MNLTLRHRVALKHRRRPDDMPPDCDSLTAREAFWLTLAPIVAVSLIVAVVCWAVTP